MKTPMHCAACGASSVSLEACSFCGSLDGFVVQPKAQEHAQAGTARSLLLLALITSYCSDPKTIPIEPEPEEAPEYYYDPRDDL